MSSSTRYCLLSVAICNPKMGDRQYMSISILLLLLISLVSSSSQQHQQQLVERQEQEDDDDVIIRRFQSYLRFKTVHPSPDYTGPVSFLISQAESIGGLQTRTLEFVPGKPVLIVTWPGSRPDLQSVLFNSHLDSVPAEPEKWVHPPFSAVRNTTDGKIYARGAQDDKCIGMQYLEAIRRLRQLQGINNPLRTVHLSYVPDEEVGGFDGAAKFVASKEFEEMNVGFVMDEGQASPTDAYRVFHADRTPWHVTIRAVGTPGHGSRMYDHSAMENLMMSIEMINKFRDSQFDLVKRGWAANSEVISVNPVFLNAGIPTSQSQGFAMNMQPSEAEAGFDIRLPPTADPDLVRNRIAHEWAPLSRNMSFEIVAKGPTRDFWGQPLMTPTDDTNPWWSVFVQAITSVGGKLGKPEILASTTDAKSLRERGIPTLGFSPMSSTPILLHDHNEFLQDAVYLRGITVYESLISKISSFKGIDK